MNLVPAVLEKDFDSIEKRIDSFSNLFDIFQLDVVDGSCAPNKTWPYLQDNIIDEMERVKNLKINFELDYMASPIDEHLYKWIELGAKKIILHSCCCEDIGKYIKIIKSTGVDVYIAFTPSVSIDKYKDEIELSDGVQCMGIAEIGKQGQSFSEDVYKIIDEIKEKHPEKNISIDGGVKLDNIKKISKTGIIQAVSGSALINGNVDENLKKFNNLIE